MTPPALYRDPPGVPGRLLLLLLSATSGALLAPLSPARAEMAPERGVKAAGVQEYPQSAILEAMKQAEEARKEWLALQQQTGQNRHAPDGDSAAPKPREGARDEAELSLSLALSRLNVAEAEAKRLRDTWVEANKDKILTLLKQHESEAAQSAEAWRKRLDTARSEAGGQQQQADMHGRVAREVIKRREERLKTARAEVEAAKQQALTARQVAGSAWRDQTASLAEMVREENTLATAEEAIVLAEEKLAAAMADESPEETQSVALAEELEQRARDARATLQGLEERSRLAAEELKARGVSIRAMADKLQNQPPPLRPTLLANTPDPLPAATPAN